MHTGHQGHSGKSRQHGFENKVIGTVLRQLVKAGFCWKAGHVKLRGRRHDLAYSKLVNKGL